MTDVQFQLYSDFSVCNLPKPDSEGKLMINLGRLDKQLQNEWIDNGRMEEGTDYGCLQQVSELIDAKIDARTDELHGQTLHQLTTKCRKK